MVAVLALSRAAVALAQAPAERPIVIRHLPVTCMIAGAHPRIDACLDPADEAPRVRLLFRAEGGPSWYFVEMAREGACFAATLPRPLPSTRRIQYAIEAVSRSSGKSRTEDFAPRIAHDVAACGAAAAPSVGRASVVVGSLVRDAPVVPAGFAASGVAAAEAPPTRRPGGGLGKRVLIGAAAIVAGGAAVAVLAGGKETDPADVDDDRDGFSERQGDCDDTDAAVRPGGEVQFSIDFAFSGTTTCSGRNPQQQVYRLTNRSCDTVSLQGLQIVLTLGGTCAGSQSYPVSLEATQVAPGASVIVRRGAPVGSVAPLCCQSYPCTQGTCTIALQYMLSTSAGTKTATQTYGIADPTGLDCPVCGSIGTDETFRPTAGSGDGLTCTAPVAPY
jgi:hypothetical protein